MPEGTPSPSGSFPVADIDSAARRKELVNFSKTHNLKFKNLNLLHTACIHRSSCNEQGFNINNERLEFLGDAVLGSVTAHLLFAHLADKSEGDLARIKSVVVSEEILSGLALQVQIDRLLVLGKGEELSGGRRKKAILADAFEALIAAIYLDTGYVSVFDFISRLMVKEIDRVLENRHKKDYKTLLQEQCQALYRQYPQYRLVKRSGPEHDRLFWVSVLVQGREYGPVTGHSKKAAEQLAAKLAWEAHNEQNPARDLNQS